MYNNIRSVGTYIRTYFYRVGTYTRTYFILDLL